MLSKDVRQIAGLMVTWPFLSESQRQAVAEATETERAELKLTMVTSPQIAEAVQAEVERRTAAFTARYQASTRAASMSPRRAAVLSVYDDVISGRFG